MCGGPEAYQSLDFVMAGHSRSKNGVASLAYVPAISIRLAPCLPKQDRRDKPGDDAWFLSHAAAEQGEMGKP